MATTPTIRFPFTNSVVSDLPTPPQVGDILRFEGIVFGPKSNIPFFKFFTTDQTRGCVFSTRHFCGKAKEMLLEEGTYADFIEFLETHTFIIIEDGVDVL